MTQDRTERTPNVDAATWTPFGGAPVHRTVDADARPSNVHLDAPSWRPRVIEGGRGHEDAAALDAVPVNEDAPAPAVEDGPAVDVLDAAAADVFAIFADAPPTPAVAEPAPAAVEPRPEPAPGRARELVEEAIAPAPAAMPVVTEAAPQAPTAPAQEATPHPTLHTPTQAAPEAPAPAQETVEAAATPHSTPWVRTALGWLDPYSLYTKPQPSITEFYTAARASIADRSGADRATEIAWAYGIGAPIAVACYTVAAAVQHKWRGLGVAVTVLLWVTAADAAPVDASAIWFWTAVGYWVSTVFILPAVIQAKQ